MDTDKSFGTISIPVDYPSNNSPKLWEELLQIICPHFAIKTLSLLIIILNILIFVILWIISAVGNKSFNCLMYYVGASYPPTFMHFHLHRLVVSAFLHFSVSHLLHNCGASFVLSFEPESILGIKRFLLLYSLTASYGIMFTSIIHSNGLAAGASTSIMGLFGYRIVRIVVRARQMDKGSYPIILGLLAASATLIVIVGKWNIFTICALAVATAINFTLINKSSLILRLVSAIVCSYFDFGFFLAFIASKGDIYGHAGGLITGILYSITQLEDTTQGFTNIIQWKKRSCNILIVCPAICVLIFLCRGINYNKYC